LLTCPPEGGHYEQADTTNGTAEDEASPSQSHLRTCDCRITSGRAHSIRLQAGFMGAAGKPQHTRALSADAAPSWFGSVVWRPASGWALSYPRGAKPWC